MKSLNPRLESKQPILVAAALALATLFTQAAWSQVPPSAIPPTSMSGTRVGSGTPEDRESIIAETLAQLQAPISIRASGMVDQNQLSTWCGLVTARLETDLQRSETALINSTGSDGHLVSYQILIDSLQATLLSIDSASTQRVLPFTRRMVSNALEVANVLSAMSQDPADVVVRRDLIKKYVQLIIEETNNWDVRLYLPYQFNHVHRRCVRHCQQNWDLLVYEAGLLQISTRILRETSDQLVTRSFLRARGGTVLRDHHGEPIRQIHPRGSMLWAPENFLKTVEVLSRLVASDIRDNLFQYQNACIIADLERISHDLSGTVPGQPPGMSPPLSPIYNNPVTAVRGIHDRLESIIARLNPDELRRCQR